MLSPSPSDATLEHWAELVAQYAPLVLGGVLLTALALAWVGWRFFEWVWRVTTRRFPVNTAPSAWPYLAVYLTLGLGLAWAAVRGFAELAETLDEPGGAPERLEVFDAALARELHIHASPVGLWAFRAVAWLGGLPVLLALLLGVAAWLWRRRERLRTFGWVAALVGDGALNTALKDNYHRTRPSAGWPNPFVSEPGWSFPSGHAMGSLVAYGMLAYLLVTHERTGSPARRLGIVAVALGLILFIGFSRIYLTVHYFSDVVGGYAAGVAWLAVCVTGTEIARRHRVRRRLAAAAAGTTAEARGTDASRSEGSPPTADPAAVGGPMAPPR